MKGSIWPLYVGSCGSGSHSFGAESTRPGISECHHWNLKHQIIILRKKILRKTRTENIFPRFYYAKNIIISKRKTFGEKTLFTLPWMNQCRHDSLSAWRAARQSRHVTLEWTIREKIEVPNSQDSHFHSLILMHFVLASPLNKRRHYIAVMSHSTCSLLIVHRLTSNCLRVYRMEIRIFSYKTENEWMFSVFISFRFKRRLLCCLFIRTKSKTSEWIYTLYGCIRRRSASRIVILKS